MRETENKLCTLFDKYEKLPLISFLIETGDQMQSKESLSYPNLRKGLLSTYISTLQPYLQIDTEYILYPTYYSRKNNQNLLYRKDTEFQYIYNIKRKNKKVLIMCFVGNDDTESQAGQNIDIVPQSMISDQYDIRTLQV